MATKEDSFVDGEVSKTAQNLPTSSKSPKHGTDSPELKDADGASTEFGKVVANHYNSLKAGDVIERKFSRIYYMRNFNNWIKSMFIGEEIAAVQKDTQERLRTNRHIQALDMCCGKGGDIKKWLHGDLKHVAFTDIAATSLEECKSRYNSLRNKGFSAEFIEADCTKVRIRSKMQDVTISFDLVSCQFAFHYCFESLPQAEVMLRNVTECLRTGGRFIGIIPNAAEIVRRLRASGGGPIENDVLKITARCEEPYPLFGAKYDFKLEGVVDCPEFLVHFPTFVSLAKKFGLKLKRVVTLPKYYRELKDQGRQLMSRMYALEKFDPDSKRLAGPSVQYEHVKEKTNVWTLSSSEWEAVSLYLLFTFEKIAPLSYDETGKPVYI